VPLGLDQSIVNTGLPGASSHAQASTPHLHRRIQGLDVLQVPNGLASQAEVARQHKQRPELVARWKETALNGLECLFQGGEQRDQNQDRIAEL
jgi:hypothetical protein